MECGVKIKCKKRFGQMLITGQPYALVDDDEKIEMKWKKGILHSFGAECSTQNHCPVSLHDSQNWNCYGLHESQRG